MKLGPWRCDVDIFGDIIVQETLPVIVGLDVVFTGASHLPINFVQVIRQQHHTAHNALTQSTLDDIFDVAEQKLKFRKEGRCVISFRKCQLRALGTKVDRLVVSYGPIARNRFCGGEIDGVGAGCETHVIGTSTYYRQS